MASDQSPDPKPKHDLSTRRALLLAIYIFVLIVLVKLYWPGWPFPEKAHAPPPAAPASGHEVPQN